MSILDSIKQMLGIDVTDTNFDQELVLHINGTLGIINRLGCGVVGYRIKDSSNTWGEFLGERTDLESVKTNIWMRVRLLFDPPQNSFLVKALQDQIAEYDFSISIL